MVFVFGWFVIRCFGTHCSVVVNVLLLIVMPFSGVYIMSFFHVNDFIIFDFSTMQSGLPWSIDILMLATFFLLAGNIAKLSGFLGCLAKQGVAIVFILAFVVYYVTFMPLTNINIRVYSSTVSCTVAAMLGIFAVISTSALVVRRAHVAGKVLTYIGRSTLWILIFHPNIQSFVMKLSVQYGCFPVAGGFAALALGLAGPIIIECSAKRMFSFVVSRGA